mgnify:CR=1 FL=1
MRLIFHGTLRDLYGPEATIKTAVPADALAGFFSQQPNHPRDMVVEVIDFDTEEKLRAETEVEEIHIVPSMFGGGGTFGKIVLGGLMIAAAVFLPGIGIALSAALKTTLIVSGAMMMLQGVMTLFMKAPTASKSEDPPPSKYLGQNQNTVASGTPITIACGRINLSGHWLSLQSDSDKLAFGTWPTNPV